MKSLRPYIPLIIGLIILGGILLFTPWAAVSGLVGRINLPTFLLLVLLSLGYYGAKAVRFWVMLRLLSITQPLARTIIVYLAAQPVTLLPAGEFYRTELLKQYGHVPRHKSAPTITLQGLIEALVLLTLALVGAFVLDYSRVGTVIVAILAVILVIALQRGWLLNHHHLINRLPFIELDGNKYRSFVHDHQRLLRPKALALLLGLSTLPVLAGISILYTIATALSENITLAQAAIGYCLPVVVSGLSFLPGGLGSSEASTLAILKLINVATASAIAITLLVRVFTLGAGLLLGLIATVLLRTIRRTP